MLRFPDCNQYLRKNLSKVPHQSLPKTTEIWKKHFGQASKKHFFFESVLFSKCARKGPPTRAHYLLILHSLLRFFSDLVGLCRPDSPKRHSLWHLPPNIMKITDWFTFWYVFLHHFCLQKCACACIPVHEFSPFVWYAFPCSCYQRQSSRMMCKTGWCGDATPQAS